MAQGSGRIVRCVVGLGVAGSLVSLLPAGAAPGDLDSTFGGDGIVNLDVGVPAGVNGVALQADGRIVLAGYVNLGGDNDDFVVIRLNPDGSDDTTFDADGHVETQIGTGNDRAFALVVQPDGKIVVAGSGLVGTRQISVVVRYDPDGALDTSFGGDGTITLDAGVPSSVRAVALQPDGKIVLAGFVDVGGGNTDDDFLVSRLNPDGSDDTSFDTDGDLGTPIGTSNDLASAVVVQPDGKIVLAGTTYDSPGRKGAVVRYNTDGGLDTSFAGNGKLILDVGAGSEVNGVALQRDGKIVLAGGVGDGGAANDFLVSRLNPDGSDDTTFDTDGHLATPIGTGFDGGVAVVVQPDGRIVLAGSTYDGMRYDSAVVRYNRDGSLDTSFGGEGKLTLDVGVPSEAHGVVVQPDGRIVLAGYAFDFDGNRENSAVVRLVGQTSRCGGELATVDLAIGGVPSRGADVIVGTAGDDLVDGLGGDDLICTRGGDDTVVGGRGDDTVVGGKGDDTVTGGRGDDSLKGNGGRDTIDGGKGTDTCLGGPGTDLVTRCE